MGCVVGLNDIFMPDPSIFPNEISQDFTPFSKWVMIPRVVPENTFDDDSVSISLTNLERP